MRCLPRALFLACLVLVGSSALRGADLGSVSSPGPRERIRLDQGWRFAFGHPSDPVRDYNHATGHFSYLAKTGYGDGPAAAGFDDRAWRELDLPHDWAVEAPFSPQASPSHGFKAAGKNFPDRSIGWYRREFAVPATDEGRRISVEFDGVYRAARVWVNGFYLGEHPSGYTGFSYDITDYLNHGGRNVIAVRVDASIEEGWFYEGAGIYRHVWLVKTAPLHVAQWGTAVTTELADNTARIQTQTTVRNAARERATFDLRQQVIGPDGALLAAQQVAGVIVDASAVVDVPCALAVDQPRLWSLRTPVLHRLVTTLTRGGEVVDRYETEFGIRTVRFDPDRGFFLNGERVQLKGTNNHQDHAGVGVALPDALHAFRLRRLQEFGVNAYRSAHHPPAPELLQACDRLGMLVIDENRLMGSNPLHLDEVARMIRRDRNHPSVILWSLGNEEWAIEGNVIGARIAATMQDFARRLDPSRQTTVGISGGWGGISKVINVAGYNYINQSNPDHQHATHPWQAGVGTEETTTQGTRGIYFDDRAKAHLAPLLKGDSGGNVEKGWKYYAERPFLAGVFFWTGFDFRGEPTPFGWPAISSQFGLLDTCGFPKDSAYYLKAWWGDEPVLHVYPHWNWPGREGQTLVVGCHSNADAVELLVNGRSFGRQAMPRNGHLEWSVPYAPGVVEARATRRGQPAEVVRVETAGPAAQLVLTPDRTTVRADGDDVVVFTVSASDSSGRTVPTADNQVWFTVDNGRVLGVGNGDPGSHEPDQFDESVTLVPVENWRGRIAPAGTPMPSAPAALPPLRELGRWRAPVPKSGEYYDAAATFTIPAAMEPGVRRTLYLPSMGDRTSVWLNGRQVARDLDTSDTGPGILLDPQWLVPGANLVQLLVQPSLGDRVRIPELDHFGTVQVLAPAPQPRRRLFNGLAQVIVQTTTNAGPVRLRATTEGVAPAESIVQAQ